MPKMPWPRFASEVQSLYVPPLRAKTTCGKIRQTLGLIAGLGVRTTADLTPGLVARFLVLDTSLSPATIRGRLGYLRAICTYAHTMQYVRVNPLSVRKDWLRGLELPEAEDERPDHLSLGQVAELLAEARRLSASWKGGRAYALTALVAYCGLRKTEALTRRWEDLDLGARILRIKPRSGWRLKTAASVQPVPMPRALVPILEAWSPRCGGSGWLFPAKRGDVPWTSGALGKRPLDALQAIGRGAGIERVTFNMLRHSWATHAEAWGLGELLVQRVLRHTTVRTQRLYRHADLENLAAAVADISYSPPPARTG